MKSKQLKEYLGKTVAYETVWGNTDTGKLIEVERNFATFEKGEDEFVIKIFNIKEVREVIN